jgi:hypothetical protein
MQDTLKAVIEDLERTLNQMHEHQRAKTLAIVHETRPELTWDDMLNPDDYREIMTNPRFVYEDGLAAGILSAKIAVRARLLDLYHEAPQDS